MVLPLLLAVAYCTWGVRLLERRLNTSRTMVLSLAFRQSGEAGG
jgi:hypothetical protein